VQAVKIRTDGVAVRPDEQRVDADISAGLGQADQEQEGRQQPQPRRQRRGGQAQAQRQQRRNHDGMTGQTVIQAADHPGTRQVAGRARHEQQADLAQRGAGLGGQARQGRAEHGVGQTDGGQGGVIPDEPPPGRPN